MNKKIAIVAGEPSSINSEIIVKSWKKIKKKYKKNIFVIGNYNLIKKEFNKIKAKVSTKKINSFSEIDSSRNLKILNVPLGSRYVLRCIDKAHELAIKKKIIGFINCPVNKNIFKLKYSGMTEYLAKKNAADSSVVMMIYNKKLSVVPISTHIPIKEISKKLNKKLIEKKIITLNNFYRKLLKRKPRIAILGLNPHNDEFRSVSEEKKIILPTIKKLKKNKYKVMGPFSADTIFLNKKKYRYDVIVGMYHDQVLAPFKAVYGFDAINVTLGLKYIRVSPDHGIAKDIVGSNKANPLSLIKAIEFIFNI
mgnify:CR=1 FL=1|tara:strand:- start:9886 stop:10809 length:924 start_codon:yes stop_codon:yes gene_type:complete